MYTVKVVENSDVYVTCDLMTNEHHARACNRYVTVKIENIYLQNSK